MAKGTCTIPDCGRPVTARGWCWTHYERWTLTGDVGTAPIRSKLKSEPAGVCASEGCERPSQVRGLCKSHVTTLRNRERRATEMCRVHGCTTGVEAAGMCSNHRARTKAGRPMYGTSPKPVPLPPPPADVCAVDGCDRDVRTKEWCYTHYARAWRNGGDPGPAVIDYRRRLTRSGVCTVEGCSLPRNSSGMCAAHYSRMRKWGDAGTAEVGIHKYPEGQACSAEGCTRQAKVRGMCRTHADREVRKSPNFHAPIKVRNWAKESCPFPGCERLAKGTDYCAGHQLQRKQGRTLAPLQRKTDPTARDDEGRKFCILCDVWQPETAFSKQKNRPDGLHQRCKRCMRTRALQDAFGITVDEFEERLAAQGGTCAICQAKPEQRRKGFAVDHDHACCPQRQTCGQCIRGILCGKCNLILGMVEDQPDTIVSMARYLQMTTYGRLI